MTIAPAPITFNYRIRANGWANRIHFHGTHRDAARMALQFYKQGLPRATEGPLSGNDLQIVNDETGVFDRLRPFYADEIDVPIRPDEDGWTVVSEMYLGLENCILTLVPMNVWSVSSAISGEIDVFETKAEAEEWAQALADAIAQYRKVVQTRKQGSTQEETQ